MDLNPLNQIRIEVILAAAGIFWVTFLVLRKVYFLPYIEVMEAREAKLREAELLMSEATAILEDAQQQASDVVNEAKERADRVAREASEKAEEYRRAALAAAGDEVGRMLEAGRSRIAKAREAETAALRDEALECVGIACNKLVGEADENVVRGAVDKLLARRVN